MNALNFGEFSSREYKPQINKENPQFSNLYFVIINVIQIAIKYKLEFIISYFPIIGGTISDVSFDNSHSIKQIN